MFWLTEVFRVVDNNNKKQKKFQQNLVKCLIVSSLLVTLVEQSRAQCVIVTLNRAIVQHTQAILLYCLDASHASFHFTFKA